MIRTGRVQELIVLRQTAEGYILGNDDDEEVLLPKSATTSELPIESTIDVFVYHDRNGRHIATTKPPNAQVNGFAKWKVTHVDHRGAHMDWGLDPELIVPHIEQKKPLDEGRWYVVGVLHDERTDRLYGSTRIEDLLDNSDLSVNEGDQVELLVFGRSDLGLQVIVNDRHQGLVHANEIFKHVAVGDRIPGWVKTIREDHKLDITLQAIGYRRYNDANTELLAKRLRHGSGFLPFNDKSSAEEIHREFGISKKAFKQALGALYKQRKVRIEEDGIVWIER